MTRRALWTTLPELVISCAEHRAEVPLMADGRREWTGAQLYAWTRRAAAALRERGVRRGDLVALDTRAARWPEVAVAYCAASWLGAVSVLVTSAETSEAAVTGLGVKLTVGEPAPGAANPVALDELLRQPDEIETPPAPAAEDALDVVFTSGTTGVPKPVVSKHSHWSGASRPEMLASRGRRVVAHTGVPIGVSGGLHGIFLNHLARGVTSLWAPTPDSLAVVCADQPVRELHMTPFAARSLGKVVGGSAPWCDGVRIIRLVGAPLPESVREQLSERFPRARIASIYALTEGGAASAVNIDGRPTIGTPAPGTEVRVIDAAGNPVPDGEVGEIAVRTPAGPPRYLLDSALNEEWLRDGWTRTGDVGVRLDGSVQLVGRAREQIVLGSGRLAPDVVEAILRRHVPPDVEFVVAGVASPGRSDAIAVFLVGREADERTERAQERLRAVKGPFRPTHVVCVNEIPRNAMGKPVRRQLVQQLLRRPTGNEKP